MRGDDTSSFPGAAVSPVELAALGADDLLAFSRRRGAGLGRTAWNHLATALPGFYRWLDLSGHGFLITSCG
jgi:hypothetical protein